LVTPSSHALMVGVAGSSPHPDGRGTSMRRITDGPGIGSPGMPADCETCANHRDPSALPGGLLAADRHAILRHLEPAAEGEPVYLGYLFVEPRRHVAELADLAARKRRRWAGSRPEARRRCGAAPAPSTCTPQ